MPDLVLGGILLAPIIAALVELAKRYGLPPDKAPFANLLLSALAGFQVLVVQNKPELLSPVALALQVLILFLAAAGVYTTSKWAGEKLRE